MNCDGFFKLKYSVKGSSISCTWKPRTWVEWFDVCHVTLPKNLANNYNTEMFQIRLYDQVIRDKKKRLFKKYVAYGTSSSKGTHRGSSYVREFPCKEDPLHSAITSECNPFFCHNGLKPTVEICSNCISLPKYVATNLADFSSCSPLIKIIFILVSSSTK